MAMCQMVPYRRYTIQKVQRNSMFERRTVQCYLSAIVNNEDAESVPRSIVQRGN